ncbi:transcription factor bHLH162-like [Ipomoea triloba]|uniref:transcription factor bHLH162-like n=1 Tax=Ipomoea triloba TaxID=35885 RepID=UPI00125CDBC0|nr:transcription factor bHLH162-like [Ipomoea triloba]
MRMQSRRSSSNTAANAEMPPKLERKHVEKKRRENLKFLYNHLFSLLPTHHISPGTMALPDQVDEAVNYIKTLQNQLEKSKQKKQELLSEQQIQIRSTTIPRKRPHYYSSSSSSSSCSNSTSKQPLIQILDIGPDIDVVLIDGLEDMAAFHNIIRTLHEHGLEVATAIFQPRGNSTLQILHQQGFGGTKTVYEKLKQAAVNGSSGSEPESLDSWDFDIWGFPILETSQEQLQNPPPYCIDNSTDHE